MSKTETEATPLNAATETTRLASADLTKPQPTVEEEQATADLAAKVERESQDPTPEERVKACKAAFPEFLASYGCSIVAGITPEWVGDGPGAKVLMSPGWTIFPVKAD